VPQQAPVEESPSPASELGALLCLRSNAILE
jgi:hypothetical protein